MRTLYPHQLRPRIYFTLGFGWKTNRMFDSISKNRNTDNTIK
jgi:hypothetical protein